MQEKYSILLNKPNTVLIILHKRSWNIFQQYMPSQNNIRF